MNGRDQLFDIEFAMDKISAGAQPQRLMHDRALVAVGHHQHRDQWHQVRQCGDAVHPRHANVQENDIRAVADHRFIGLSTITSLRHHLKPRTPLQQGRQTRPHDRIVIDDHDP